MPVVLQFGLHIWGRRRALALPAKRRRIGEGHNEQRTAGSWQLRVFIGGNPDGRPVQVSRTFQGTKRQAQTLRGPNIEHKPIGAVGSRGGRTSTLA
jgi:hypothetical protein